jgi:5-formyltetrahydrofolate cyclo-ligase
MGVDKHVIRAAMRLRRRGLATADVMAAGLAVCARLMCLPAYRAARAVAAYVAHENEVPTAPILAQAGRTGRVVYLPRCGAAPALVRWQAGDPLVAGPGGVLQPGAEGGDWLVQDPAIVLLPVVGWDAAGARLGRGTGFYDRLLARLRPEVVRVGLAYDFQEVPRLPCEPWDVPMHYVITERQTVRCARPHPGVSGSPGVQKGGLQLE